jgi:hypothetical protein
MNTFFYIFLSMIAMLSITFDELSETHQAAWKIVPENLDSAEVLFMQALAEYRSYLDVRREAVALIDLASLYNKKNEPLKRLSYLHKAERLTNNFDDTTIISTLYSNLIFVYSAYNRYDRALEYLNIKRKYIAEDDSLRISDYYKDLASISSAMGNNQAAIDYIRKADAIIPLDVEKKRNIYISYGYYFDELGIADSALYYLDRAMYYDGWKNKIKLQAVLNYYSTKQKYYGNVEIKTIDSLETIIKEHDLKGDLPQLLALKSQVLKDTFYIHQAIDISKKHRPEFYLDLIEELADLQFKLKHYEESRTNSELYHKLKDSVEQYKSSVILKNLSEFTPESDKTTEEKENYILYILLAAILALILYIVYTKSRKS